MNLDKYPVKADDERYLYEFYSEGPAGRIKKVVLYELIEKNLFNLGFGDWDEDLKKVIDLNRSNNGDRDKVLATVAATVLDFIEKIPDARIFVEGTTPARTRLYQIGIGNNLTEINEIFEVFEVFGYIENHWEFFCRGKNYEAFLIKRR